MSNVLPALGGLWSRAGEALDSALELIVRRLPIYIHHAVWEALGSQEEGVSGAIIGKIDPDGHPIAGSQRRLDVDTIVCAYGFAPSTALTMHLGCKHQYDPNLCAYVPQVDKNLQTSLAVPNVSAWLAAEMGVPVLQLGQLSIRPPIIPVRLKGIAAIEHDTIQ